MQLVLNMNTQVHYMPASPKTPHTLTHSANQCVLVMLQTHFCATMISWRGGVLLSFTTWSRPPGRRKMGELWISTALMVAACTTPLPPVAPPTTSLLCLQPVSSQTRWSSLSSRNGIALSSLRSRPCPSTVCLKSCPPHRHACQSLAGTMAHHWSTRRYK